MKLRGKVSNWNDDKGFGFVEPSGGGTRAFVHIKAFVSRTRRPTNGDAIIYQLVRENSNRYKATHIQLVADASSMTTSGVVNGSNSFGSYFTVIFCVFLLVSTAVGALAPIVSVLYLAMSLFTFMAYAMDKYAAQKRRWRTKESTLQLLALFGGWPGAFIAQNTLQHKSSKKKFKNVHNLCVVLNVTVLICFHTNTGTRFFDSVSTSLLTFYNTV